MNISVAPELYLTTTFRATETRSKYNYSRTENPNFDNLKKKMLKLYDRQNYKCSLFPSGLSAIANVFDVYSESHFSDSGPGLEPTSKTIVIIGEVYCDTFRKIFALKDSNKYLNFAHFEIDDYRAIKKCLVNDQSVTLVFLESCTNPHGRIFDFRLLKKWQKNKKFKICVDNSWLSPALFNPFDFGANLVVDSVSKYIGGGRVIMGTIVGERKALSTVTRQAKINGLHVSPFDCWLVSDACETLKFRAQASGELAAKIAKWLKEKTVVWHPSLPGHAEHSLWEEFKMGSPGVLRFHVKCSDKETIMSAIKKSEIIYATSYGKSETLIDCYPEITTVGTYLRLALGWDDNFTDLTFKLNRFLSLLGQLDSDVNTESIN